MKPKSLFTAIAALLLMSACTPEVGSQEWCDDMKDKPKGDWTANEAKDYASYCVFGNTKED